MGTVCFTLDIDWASEEFIAEAIEVFENAALPCTLFATHDSPLIRSLDRRRYEIGLHPNFNPILNATQSGPHTRTAEHIVKDLRQIYPEAVGIRSHSLTQNGYLLNLFVEQGFQFDSNEYRPYDPATVPYKLWNGLIRVPFNWTDDVHWLYGFTFTDARIDLARFPCALFNFHPAHLFLNTSNAAAAAAAKPYMHDPKRYREFRNRTEPGVKDMLLRLIELAKLNGCEVLQMGSLASRYRDYIPGDASHAETTLVRG